MPTFAHYLDKARKELAGKTLKDIQVETALVWCGRACVAAQEGNGHDAIEYAHEAIEHAALSGFDDLLKDVRRMLRAYGVEV